MEPYTSYNSPPLALPAASAEVGTTLVPSEFGGFMLSPAGEPGSWGLLPAPPADLADIVDIAAHEHGVIALRAYTSPRIVLKPESQEIFAGYSGPVFRAHAAGFPVPALQWQKGTQPVAGQTQAVLTLAQATAADAGSYQLTATNAYGTATSDPAVLTVTTPDVFSTWTGQNFTPAAITAGLTAPHADPGGHGVPNLLRYALELDPATPDTAELPRLAFGRHPLLPANVGGLYFCVPENVSDVVFRLGVSTNLGTWKVLDVEPVLGPVVNGKRQLWLPCPPEEQDGARNFYKLIVEPAPPNYTPRF
ncbi:MAG: immunoglobulin domain-containing protein [Prosthecobacter sp.]